MRELIRSKAVVYLAAIFVAGLAAGAVGGIAWSKRGGERKGPPPDSKQMVERILAGLTHELKLTDEQVQQIRPLVEKTGEEIHTCHRDLGMRIEALIKEGNRRMEIFLTEEQKQRLAELERQHAERKRDDRSWKRSERPPKPD